MEDWTQFYLRHGIQPLTHGSDAQPDRINITFRWFRHHCPNCMYHDTSVAAPEVPMRLPVTTPSSDVIKATDAVWIDQGLRCPRKATTPDSAAATH